MPGDRNQEEGGMMMGPEGEEGGMMMGPEGEEGGMMMGPGGEEGGMMMGPGGQESGMMTGPGGQESGSQGQEAKNTAARVTKSLEEKFDEEAQRPRRGLGKVDRGVRR